MEAEYALLAAAMPGERTVCVCVCVRLSVFVCGVHAKPCTGRPRLMAAVFLQTGPQDGHTPGFCQATWTRRFCALWTPRMPPAPINRV